MKCNFLPHQNSPNLVDFFSYMNTITGKCLPDARSRCIATLSPELGPQEQHTLKARPKHKPAASSASLPRPLQQCPSRSTHTQHGSGHWSINHYLPRDKAMHTHHHHHHPPQTFPTEALPRIGFCSLLSRGKGTGISALPTPRSPTQNSAHRVGFALQTFRELFGNPFTLCPGRCRAARTQRL